MRWVRGSGLGCDHLVHMLVGVVVVCPERVRRVYCFRLHGAWRLKEKSGGRVKGEVMERGEEKGGGILVGSRYFRINGI